MKLKKENRIACVLVGQLVEADRAPCRDLPRKLPCRKTYKLTETRREAANPTQKERYGSIRVP